MHGVNGKRPTRRADLLGEVPSGLLLWDGVWKGLKIYLLKTIDLQVTTFRMFTQFS